MRTFTWSLLGSVAGLLATGCASAAPQGTVETEAARLRVVEVADGLEHPWSLAFLPDGDILVTERPGRLRLIEDGRLRPEPLAGVPEVHARRQGGLLDVAVDPEFAANRTIYLSYAHEGEGGTTTRVMRARLTGDGLADQNEWWDTDGDGLSDGSEVNADGWGTNPLSADTDGDGYTDGDELFIYGTDPNSPASAPAQQQEGSTLRVQVRILPVGYDGNNIPGDSEPLEGVTVTVAISASEWSASAETDADGLATFEDLDEGEHDGAEA